MNEEIRTSTIRNRRYKKLLQLRDQGFFDEEAIMLRHPLLYFTYVGKYKNMRQRNFTSAQEFFYSQLLNSEYRNLLQKENNIKVGKMVEEDDEEEEENELKEINEKQLELNEQNLIDHIEELFLEGKQKQINYEQIDFNEEYDDLEEVERDEEEKYFDNVDEDQERDPANNTGIQDF